MHPRPYELRGRPGRAQEAMLRLDRTERVPALLDAPRSVTEAFAGMRVAVFGAGSVGSHLVDAVARLSPRALLVVDRGRLKPQSAITHPCDPRDLGRSKAWVAGERAKAIAPGMQVLVFDGPFEALPLSLLAGIDIALLASDNLRAELTVGAFALEYGFDLIQGAVYGPTLSAQVRVFASGGDGEHACPACGYGAAEWEALDRETVFSCSGGDGATNRPGAPTASLPHLCGMAANLALMELTGRVVGLPRSAGSVSVDYSGFGHRSTVTPLRRAPECPLPHGQPRPRVVVRELAGGSPQTLRQLAGCDAEDPRRVLLRVEGHRWAPLAVCGCDGHPSIASFVRDGAPLGRCAACGRELAVHPLHGAREVAVAALGPAASRPLGELGVATAAVVRVRGATCATLFVDPSQPRLGGRD